VRALRCNTCLRAGPAGAGKDDPCPRTECIGELDDAGELEALDVALRMLGDEPAPKLERLGIRGDRNDGFACPLAEYLTACGFGEVFVPGSEDIMLYHEPLTTNVASVRLNAFSSVVEFLDAFDGGLLPELERLEAV
jgi:hypothetical protein